MAQKRYSAEQIVATLREAEKLPGQEMTIPQSCKRLGISDQKFYRWRLKYGALKEDEAQRFWGARRRRMMQVSTVYSSDPRAAGAVYQ